MNNLKSLLSKIGNAADPKLASAQAQPPSEGHPTDHIDDHVAVSEGETITSAADDQVDRLGTLAAGGNPVVNDKEKKPATMQTEVLDGTSTPSELNPGEGLEDPGPDSSHPASPNNNEKYASMTDPQAIILEMNKAASYALGRLSKAAAAAPAAAPQNKSAAAPAAPTAPAAPAVAAEGENKFARALNQVIAPERRQIAIEAAQKGLAPYVEHGIQMANKLANFMAAADQDPAAAAAMMGGGDPGTGGGDPGAMMGGGDPSAMGGGGAGGGSDPLQDLIDHITQVAQMLGIAPEELMQSLAGAGGGGAPPAGGDAGGGAPPAGDASAPSSSPGDSAPKDSSSSEGGGSDKSKESESESKSDDNESKEAAAPAGKGQQSKRARNMQQEIGSLLEELNCGD